MANFVQKQGYPGITDTNLGDVLRVCTQNFHQPSGFFEQLCHCSIIRVQIHFSFLLFVEQLGQVVTQTQLEFNSSKCTIKPGAEDKPHNIHIRIGPKINNTIVQFNGKSKRYIWAFLCENHLLYIPNSLNCDLRVALFDASHGIFAVYYLIAWKS